jgi:Rrf2 family protein
MLTKTTISVIRALTYLGSQGQGVVLSPRHIAERLGESPTYLAKVMRLAVRADILRAQRGVNGGVVLHRPPRDISLLAIVEACQGAILGRFCEDTMELKRTCAFHRAAAELHRAMVRVMSHWTLQHFIEKPGPDKTLKKQVQCWMETIPRGDLPRRTSQSRGTTARVADGKRQGRRKQDG